MNAPIENAIDATYKIPSFFLAKNRIEAVSRSVLVLELIDKPDILKLADSTHELTKACYANGAVDVSLLVSYADLHTLATNGYFSAVLKFDLFQDLAVKLSYCFADEYGCFHCVPHSNSLYLEKYWRSVAA